MHRKWRGFYASHEERVCTLHVEGFYASCTEGICEFASQVGWLQHARGGRCQQLEDMSESQLKARRATRAKAVLERGEKLFKSKGGS